jgi:hypothetical protein
MVDTGNEIPHQKMANRTRAASSLCGGGASLCSGRASGRPASNASAPPLFASNASVSSRAQPRDLLFAFSRVPHTPFLRVGLLTFMRCIQTEPACGKHAASIFLRSVLFSITKEQLTTHARQT